MTRLLNAPGDPAKLTASEVIRAARIRALLWAAAVVVVWGVGFDFSTAVWPFWVATIALVIAVPWLSQLYVRYFRAPFMIHRSARFPLAPRFAPFDPADAGLLPEVRAAIDERLEAVESLGFTLAGHFSTGVRPARAATGYVSLWHNARHGDEARLFTAHAHSERPLPDGRVVESTRATTTFLFVTRYADGTKVVTANTCAQGNFARNPHATVLVYPEIGDPAALYRIHRKAVDELGSLSRIQPPRIDDPVAYLAKTSSEEWQRQVDRGEAVVDESDQVFRPTWKGAVLMALRLHWPWRQLRRGSLERRSRRFLRRFPELNEAIR